MLHTQSLLCKCEKRTYFLLISSSNNNRITSKLTVYRNIAESQISIMTCIRIVFGVLLFIPLIQTQASDANLNYQQSLVKALSRSMNDFGAKLTRALTTQDNHFISPMSISMALAMTYLGAKGNTAKQMEEVLEFSNNSLNGIQVHQAFKEMVNFLNNCSNEYSLSLANGIFQDKQFPASEKYVDNIQNYYNAMFKLVDFANEEKTKEEINKFVAHNTTYLIPNFLTESFHPETELALVNVIYFKGLWVKRFRKDFIRIGTFYKIDNSIKEVKFMELKKERFPYFDDASANYKYISLPYKGDRFSMIIALPNDKNQMPNLEMTSDKLRQIKDNMESTLLDKIKIPKFKLEYKKELKQILQQLGIKDLFSDISDLTEISSAKKLKVSSVIHDAIIKVNGQGSKAAAKTHALLVPLSGNWNNFKITNFVADHSFAFYIVDTRNELILFSGLLTNP